MPAASRSPRSPPGIYGYPKDDAARIAIATLQSTPTRVQLARLVAFDAATLALYQALLDR